MNYKLLTGAVALVFSSTLAFATPEYTDQTSGNFTAALNDGSSDAAIDAELNGGSAGYYLWNSTSTDWHLRWTADSTSMQQFYGTVSIFNNTINSWSEFQFEAGDGTVNGVIPAGGDDANQGGGLSFGTVEWESGNNCCWDGFDFYLNEGFASGDEMRLDLYSTIWDLSAYSGGAGADGGLAGDSIYISDAFNTPDVEILDALAFNDGSITMMGQSFEITVPEPGTLALLGLGLAGLGAARRRKA